MRITATIQDNMMTDLMRLTEAQTKTEAVNIALAEWLRHKKIQKIKTLRGKIPVQNNLDSLRNIEIKEMEQLNDRRID